MANTPRIKSMDALKLFAIFLVLWGHCVQHLLSSECYDEPLYRIIYSFHMPLFMAISGFFGARIAENSFINAFTKKFRQLLIPAISFGLIRFIYDFAINQSIKTATYSFIVSFWFLKSAFLCSIVYFLVTKPKKKTVRIFLLIGSLLICPFLLRHTFAFGRMYPCFVMGAWLHDHIEWVKRHIKTLLLVSSTLFVALLLFWDASFWTEGCNFRFLSDLGGKALYGYKYVYRLTIGFAGTLTFFSLFEYLSQYIPESRIGNTLCRWGKYTLGIYCLQAFILEIFLRQLLNFDSAGFFTFNFVIAPLISFGVLLLCLGCIKIIHFSQWTSWAFLGESLPRKK